MVRYHLGHARKHARAACWETAAAVGYLLRLPWRGDWDDEAVLRRAACAFDFTPVFLTADPTEGASDADADRRG